MVKVVALPVFEAEVIEDLAFTGPCLVAIVP